MLALHRSPYARSKDMSARDVTRHVSGRERGMDVNRTFPVADHTSKRMEPSLIRAWHAPAEDHLPEVPTNQRRQNDNVLEVPKLGVLDLLGN